MSTLRSMIHRIGQYTWTIRDHSTDLEKFDQTMELLIKLIYELIDFSEMRPVIFKKKDLEIYHDFLNNFTKEIFIQQKKHLFPRRVFQLSRHLSEKVRNFQYLLDTRPSNFS
jgi:hypothetical protein